jgi:GTP cyclohydrolase I
MRKALAAFVKASGLEGSRRDLGRTPARAAQAWKDGLLAGYAESPAKILEPLRSSRSRDVVAVREIPFVSTCPHHLLPFHGRAHIAYLPGGAIVGVSRLAALVHSLSRRLQIQEELTEQIARELHERTGARGAACIMEATHLCMTGRYGRSPAGRVVTAAFSGCYQQDPHRRSEIIALLGGPPSRGRPGSRRR